MGGAVGFDWVAVAERLKLHGAWTPEMESALRICEVALLEVLTEMKDTPADA